MNFKERVLELVEAKKKLSAEQIYRNGREQKNFDFKKGLDDLIKADKSGFFIDQAGATWKNFEYEKGLKALIKIDKNGYYIYRAGVRWKKFEFEKGLKILKALQNKAYYKEALRDWPKGIKQSQEKSKEIKATAKKLPKKELKL